VYLTVARTCWSAWCIEDCPDSHRRLRPVGSRDLV